MTRLLLVRHGQTDWNVLKRYQGRTDTPLNDAGLREAARVAERLQHVELAAVYSSELTRAYTTASLIAEPHGIAVAMDARLDEIAQGEWEGLCRGEIAERYRERLARWEEDPTSTCPPGGESLSEVRERVLSFLHEITLRHPGEAVCIVAHKVTNAVIKSESLGAPIAELLRMEPAHAVWEEIEVSLDKPSGRL